MNRKWCFVIALIFSGLLMACQSVNEGFNSIELTSSKGEKIYINSLNYGMTSDGQTSIITKNKDKLKYEIDTNGVVYGLEPFIYKFQNDTLTLIFNGIINYKVNDTFNTIVVQYKKLENAKYGDFLHKAINNDTYHCVPLRIDKKQIKGMPIPPSASK